MRIEKIVSHANRHPYMGDEGKNGLYLRFFYAVLSGIASTINFAAYTIEIGPKNTEMLTSGVWNSENTRMLETMSHRPIKEIPNFGILFVIKMTFIMRNDLVKGLWL